MVRWVGDVFSSCAVYNFTFKDPGFGSHRPHKPSGLVALLLEDKDIWMVLVTQVS